MTFPIGQGFEKAQAILSATHFNSKQDLDEDTLECVTKILGDQAWQAKHPKETLRGLQLLNDTDVVSAIFTRIVSPDLVETNPQEARQLFTRFCEIGDQEDAINLLKNGLSYTQLSESGQSILDDAIEYGLLDLVTEILSDNQSLDQLPQEGFPRTLHLAVFHGNDDVISAILEKAPDIINRTYEGLTPLARAVLSDNAAACLSLIDKGANRKFPVKNGYQVDVFVSAGTESFSYPLVRMPVVTIFRKSDQEEEAEDLTSLALSHDDPILQRLVKTKDLDTLTTLVEMGLSLPKSNPNDYNPIYNALESNGEDILIYLLQKSKELGLDINAATPKGISPLHLFLAKDLEAFNNPKEVLQAFIRGGADFNRPDLSGDTPIQRLMKLEAWDLALTAIRDAEVTEASWEDDYARSLLGEAIVSESPELVSAVWKIEGMLTYLSLEALEDTLALACEYDCHFVIKDLIEAGVDLSKLTSYESNPMAKAIVFHCVKSIEELLDQQANPTVTLNGQAEVQLSKREGEVLNLTVLKKSRGEAVDEGKRCTFELYKDIPPLLEMAYQGDMESVSMLLDLGFSPTARDVDHETLLHYAAAGGTQDVVVALLERAAHLDLDINGTDYKDTTPLNLFCREGMLRCKGSPKEILESFIEVGADFNIRDNEGQTAIQHLMSKEAWDLAQYVIEKVQITGDSLIDPGGVSLLTEAMRKAPSKLVLKIWEKPLFDRFSTTHYAEFLSLACQKGYAFMIAKLIEENQDLLNSPFEEISPLAVATIHDNPKCIQALLEAGADSCISLAGQSKVQLSCTPNEGVKLRILQRATGAEIPTDQEISFTLNPDDPILTALAGRESDGIEGVSQLLEIGFDPLKVNDEGNNILHLAVEHHDLELANSLLKGPYINDQVLCQRNHEKETPFELLCKYELKGYGDLLLDTMRAFCERKSVDINHRSDDLFSPLLGVLVQRHWGGLEILLAHNASLLIPTEEYGYVLDEALEAYPNENQSNESEAAVDPLKLLGMIPGELRKSTAEGLWASAAEDLSLLAEYPGTVIAIALLDPVLGVEFPRYLEHAVSEELPIGLQEREVEVRRREIICHGLVATHKNPAALVAYLARYPRMSAALWPHFGAHANVLKAAANDFLANALASLPTEEAMLALEKLVRLISPTTELAERDELRRSILKLHSDVNDYQLLLHAFAQEPKALWQEPRLRDCSAELVKRSSSVKPGSVSQTDSIALLGTNGVYDSQTAASVFNGKLSSLWECGLVDERDLDLVGADQALLNFLGSLAGHDSLSKEEIATLCAHLGRLSEACAQQSTLAKETLDRIRQGETLRKIGESYAMVSKILSDHDSWSHEGIDILCSHLVSPSEPTTDPARLSQQKKQAETLIKIGEFYKGPQSNPINSVSIQEEALRSIIAKFRKFEGDRQRALVHLYLNQPGLRDLWDEDSGSILGYLRKFVGVYKEDPQLCDLPIVKGWRQSLNLATIDWSDTGEGNVAHPKKKQKLSES